MRAHSINPEKILKGVEVILWPLLAAAAFLNAIQMAIRSDAGNDASWRDWILRILHIQYDENAVQEQEACPAISTECLARRCS